MPPQVSIIVPVYNREQLIVECIQSVSQQSFRDFELIIVDDGSTDDSRGIAESTLKHYGLAGDVISIQNSGPDIARDTGLERARGQYIALLDSDDLWEREYLEYMLTNLREHASATFAFSDFYIRDEDTSATYTKSSTLHLIDTVTRYQADAECVLIEEHLFQYLLQEQPVFIGALVFKREALARAGCMTRYIQRRIGSLEWEFILRLALTGPALYCRKPLVTIRKHQGNISAEYITQVEGELAVLETVREHYQLTKSDRRLIDREVSRRSLSVGYQYFSRGLYPQARNALRGSMLHRPTARAAKYYCLSMLPDSYLRGIRNLLGKS
jgi:glycosyltransferase involved in cell wall biosynthesis